MVEIQEKQTIHSSTKESKMTFKDFCLEAYSRAERESHTIKPTGKKKYHLRFAPIDANYRKYNMPIVPPQGPLKTNNTMSI